VETVDKDEFEGVRRNPKVFKFDGLYGNGFLIVVLPLLLVSIGVSEFFRGHYRSDLILLAMACFFLTLGYVQILVKADIRVDDEWISRFAFGRLIQRVRWKNIKIIKVFDEFGGSGRGYNIYPIESKNSGLGLSRKLAFDDGMRNPREFARIMNLYICEHNIKIESVTKGVKTFPSQLEEIKPRG